MTRSTRALTIAALAGLGAAAPSLGQDQPARSAAAPPPAPPAARSIEPVRIETADDLLRALETADAGLETLTADIRYTRDFGAIEGGERQVWEGDLFFDASLETAGPPRRGFAVVFEKSFVNNQERNEERAFIFDGEWLVEKIPAEKQMIRRRVVPPGEVADPLKIGEGPFPIPIGQRREDILRRFTVELRPAAAGLEGEESDQRFVAGTYQLRLVPREGTDESREFREVLLWYRASDLMPRMARTVNADEGRTEVKLINHKQNQPIPGGVFDTAPPPRSAGWDVQTQEWRGEDDNRR